MRYCIVHEILRYEPSLRAGHGIHAHCFVMDIPSTLGECEFHDDVASPAQYLWEGVVISVSNFCMH
jgi:hypothetical protein